MAILSGSVSGNSTPGNVSSGDYTVTFAAGLNCGGAARTLRLDDTLGLTPGRYVFVRAPQSAGGITNYAGTNVTPPTGLKVYGVSHEKVNYGTAVYDCIVVTLVSV